MICIFFRKTISLAPKDHRLKNKILVKLGERLVKMFHLKAGPLTFCGLKFKVNGFHSGLQEGRLTFTQVVKIKYLTHTVYLYDLIRQPLML